MIETAPAPSPVYVVDDDAAMRATVAGLLTESGYLVREFDGVEAFFAAAGNAAEGCIVSDMRMPGADGLALQRLIAERGLGLPIVFISGTADIPLTVRAMQEGAYTFLTKPLRAQDLLDAVAGAIALERRTRQDRLENRRLAAAYAGLEQRERVIMDDVAAGEQSKVIAHRLGLSEISIKKARGRIMRKMGADSLPQLARIVERLRRL